MSRVAISSMLRLPVTLGLLVLCGVANAQEAAADAVPAMGAGNQYPYVNCPQVFSTTPQVDALHFHTELETHLSIYGNLWGSRRFKLASQIQFPPCHGYSSNFKLDVF